MSLTTELCLPPAAWWFSNFFQHWNFLSDILHKTSKLGLLWVSGNQGLSRLASSTKSGGPHGTATELWVVGSGKEPLHSPWLHVTVMDGATPTLPPLQSPGWRPGSQGLQRQRPERLTAWAVVPTLEGPQSCPIFILSCEGHRNITRDKQHLHFLCLAPSHFP